MARKIAKAAISERTLSQVWCGETLIGSQGAFCCKSAKSSAEDPLFGSDAQSQGGNGTS